MRSAAYLPSALLLLLLLCVSVSANDSSWRSLSVDALLRTELAARKQWDESRLAPIVAALRAEFITQVGHLVDNADVVDRVLMEQWPVVRRALQRYVQEKGWTSSLATPAVPVNSVRQTHAQWHRALDMFGRPALHLRMSATQPSFILAVPPTGKYSKWITRSGMWDPETSAVAQSILSKGCSKRSPDGKPPLVVDVGPFAGFTALLAASHGCRVLVFEPSAKQALLVRINADLNDMSELIEVHNNLPYMNTGTSIKYETPDDLNFFGDDWLPQPGHTRSVAIHEYVDEDVLLVRLHAAGFAKAALQGVLPLLERRRVENFIMFSALDAVPEAVSLLREAYAAQGQFDSMRWNPSTTGGELRSTSADPCDPAYGFYETKAGSMPISAQETSLFTLDKEMVEHWRRCRSATLAAKAAEMSSTKAQ